MLLLRNPLPSSCPQTCPVDNQRYWSVVPTPSAAHHHHQQQQQQQQQRHQRAQSLTVPPRNTSLDTSKPLITSKPGGE